MDKFVVEQLTNIKELADELQACFIDDDAYSRTPSPTEWRRAGRTVRQISLACHELFGYASACRILYIDDARNSLRVVSSTQTDTKTPDVGTSDNEEEQGFFEYTQKEIQKMPKKIQGLMLVNRKRCHYRRKTTGKNKYTYEVRFRAGGYNLSACGKTKELAKENMRQKLLAAPSLPTDHDEQDYIPETFHAFSMYYFENFRKEKVAPITYRVNINRYQKHIQPAFGERPIAKIFPGECKRLIDKLRAEGKSKTADDVFSLLSVIFKGAIAHGLIERNPMATVFKPKHERVSGTALTAQEENVLMAHVAGTDCAHAIALALYCGLRPNELYTAQLDGDFIKTPNSKRKSKKVEYKRIYVCARLRAVLPKDGVLHVPHVNKLRNKIHEVLPDHRLYDLRTTFNSRCKELGLAEPARAHFMGHSLGAIGNAYTDLSDSYLQKEGKKLDLW